MQTRVVFFGYIDFRNATSYGLSIAAVQNDPTLLNERIEMIKKTARILHNEHLIRMVGGGVGSLSVTGLGRIAAQFYVSHETAAKFDQHLDQAQKEPANIARILELVGSASEFERLKVRESYVHRKNAMPKYHVDS